MNPTTTTTTTTITPDYYSPNDIKKLEGDIEAWLPMFKHTSPWLTTPPDVAGKPIPPEYDTYLPYACNICKRGPLQNIKLSHCSQCRIMKYCCKGHQKKDWKNHKKWCQVYNKCVSKYETVKDEHSWRRDYNQVQKDFRSVTGIHTALSQIYCMQPRCQRCFKAGAKMQGDLIPCPRCYGVALCEECLVDEEGGSEKKHKCGIFHSNPMECDQYFNVMHTIGMIIDQGGPLALASQHNYHTLFRPKDWGEYMEKKKNDFSVSTMIHMTPVLHLLTDSLSFPMTIHHALSKEGVDRRDDKSRLVVHCVGADVQEEQCLRAFAEIARLDPSLQEYKFVLIGPNVSYSTDTENGRVIPFTRLLSEEEGEECLDTPIGGTIQVWKGLYHSLQDKLEEKPDIFVAFNCGITDPSHTPYWWPTLSLIKEKGIPLIITGYTCLEVADDITFLQNEVGMDVLEEATPNPFRSLQPRPDPVKEGNIPFYYQNICYAIATGH
jgi:hypothetical protein